MQATGGNDSAAWIVIRVCQKPRRQLRLRGGGGYGVEGVILEVLEILGFLENLEPLDPLEHLAPPLNLSSQLVYHLLLLVVGGESALFQVLVGGLPLLAVLAL